MPFLLIKWIHILSAIIAVGSNATYGIWLSRAARNVDVLPFTLKTIKWIDDRVANRAYGLLIITGLLMVYIVRLSLTTPWLITAIILYVIVVLIGLLVYTPNLRNQIQILEREGFGSPVYQALARRGTILGMVLGLITMVIVFLMVVKPGV